MASRDIKDLTPKMQELYKAFSEKMSENGLFFVVTCTARIMHEQAALYVQGRKPITEVNMYRKLANLPPITQASNKIVTWTMKSMHIVRDPSDKSQAFDIALKYPGGGPHWDLKIDVNQDDIPDYQEAGEIGEAVGLVWGGRFKGKPDYCHFEEPANG